MHAVPIDYDRALYLKARQKSDGTDEKLFGDYFDLQHEMLEALKPPIVGHFDLIRLLSDNPDASFMQWTGVWQKILRNLDFIQQYGGIVELNTAALRKGLSEPYPNSEICKVSINCYALFSVKALTVNRNFLLEEEPSLCLMIATASIKSVRTMAEL